MSFDESEEARQLGEIQRAMTAAGVKKKERQSWPAAISTFLYHLRASVGGQQKRADKLEQALLETRGRLAAIRREKAARFLVLCWRGCAWQLVSGALAGPHDSAEDAEAAIDLIVERHKRMVPETENERRLFKVVPCVSWPTDPPTDAKKSSG